MKTISFRWVTVVLCAAGCVGDTSVEGDAGPDATAVDSGADVAAQDSGNDVAAKDSGSTDGGADVDAGPACDLSKPFGTPTPVIELNTAANEGDARLTHDELTVYFTRAPTADAGVDGGAGLTDMFVASRSNKTSPFSGISPVASLDTASNETSPSPTGDDLTLYYTTDKTGLVTGYWDVIAATRANTAAAFGSPSSVLGVSNAGSEQLDVFVMASNLVVYYSSNTSTNNYPFYLYRASRATTSDTFAVDSSGVLAALDIGNRDRSPVVTPDELTLYFATDRSGGSDYDIYVATRQSKSVAFGNKTDVAELNTTNNEIPSWISDDGCRMYFTQSGDIYTALKPQ